MSSKEKMIEILRQTIVSIQQTIVNCEEARDVIGARESRKDLTFNLDLLKKIMKR